MTTRSASAVPPATPTAAPSTGSEAPWSVQAAQELLAKAEHDRNYWKREAGRLEEALRVASAALSEKQDRVSFMERGVSHFYREVAALREKLKRWDQRSWTELSIAVLKGGETNQLDYTVDIRDCVSFRGALKEAEILREREQVEAIEEAEAIAHAEAHTRKHKGQDYGCEPVLPYHDKCSDTLHLYLNVAGNRA